MGTVGLSFGSPTSGAGFDVSSTVAEIVGNLQNVETPWKNQLTALQSQDTAISSLGTLFSNLSNDISSLTDFTGILAQKTGSSSDTNALQLTAADSTAVAGTHTATVTNLAQTSSGYLAEIAGASTKLSGSVTLQVGSGTAQTIALNSSDNTLAGLAAAINSSGVGITANVLTDSTGSRLSLVSGTSGAGGNITVSSDSIVAATNKPLHYTVTAGSTSSGALDGIANANDTLTGSIAITNGSGAAQTFVMGAAPSSGAATNTYYTGAGAGDNTLSGLEGAINTANIGVTASIVTNSNGSQSLSLAQAPGSSGALTATSSILDNNPTLGYTSTVTGADANLTVDGIGVTSASNTVTDVIPGVTFQLLAPSTKESDGSLEQIQVVIGNDNTDVESTVNQFVSDYNSLISAMNTQEGNNSSGNPEPLFGSPTLSLLQQQLLGGLNVASPNGSLDAISDNAAIGTTLSGSMTIAVGSGPIGKIVLGAGTNTVNTFCTGTSVNTLSSLASAINAANSGTMLSYSATAGSSTAGALTAAGSGTTVSGSLAITVGGATENIAIGAAPSAGAASDTVYTGSGSGYNMLSGLAGAINQANIGVTANVTTASNGLQTLSLTSGSAGALSVSSGILAAGLGVTANVVTSDGESSLSLLSQTAGTGGALSVASSIAAASNTALGYTDNKTNSTEASGSLGSVAIQVGSGPAKTIALSSDNTLSGLESAITAANIGVTASIVPSTGDGPYSIQLVSGTTGSAGALTVTSSLYDTTAKTSTTLNYTNSSDINSLTSLGIGVNDDGTLTYDATSLDSVLNSDYSGVVGFFQSASGWGQTFSNTLTNAGTSSSTGILALASSSNSNIESTLNADISKEESLISAQQTSLTAELNSANEIMQELPSQLDGVNELYSAITGYNENTDG
jgi:flagellar hook-associated protein 2